MGSGGYSWDLGARYIDRMHEEPGSPRVSVQEGVPDAAMATDAIRPTLVPSAVVVVVVVA